MNEGMSPAIHVVIPARYASSRLPGKPLVDLAGKPMIVRVYEQALAAFKGDGVQVIIATDDIRIAEVLEGFSIPYVMTKVEHESGTDRIAEVIEKLGLPDSDIVINIQGDEPLVPVDMLAAFKELCIGETNLEMATLSAPIESVSDVLDSNVVKVVTSDTGNALYFSRSPIPFVRDVDTAQWDIDAFKKHIGVYAYSCGALMKLAALPQSPLEVNEKLEQLRALSNDIKIKVLAWGANPPHGVDTPADVERVVDILKSKV